MSSKATDMTSGATDTTARPGGGRLRVDGRRARVGARRARDRGAVMVEFAGLFPLILVVFAAMWQCVVIGYGFYLASNAADEGARAATIASAGDAEAACREAALARLPGGWDADVSCPRDGDLRTASVDLRVPVLFPGAVNLPVSIPGTAATTEEGPS